MKLRVLIGAAAAALVLNSVALAAQPPGKGKPTTGTGCKPAVTVILTGSLAADGAAAPSSLSVTVKGGNSFATAYRKATTPVSVAITSTTKISRQGDHNPADLKSGDRVNIRASMCKASLANGATPALTATRVTAHPTS